MRIYDGDHSVGSIIEDCRTEIPRGIGGPNQIEPLPSKAAGIDLKKLNQRLNSIDVNEIRRRRQRLNIFSQEVLVSADPDCGISFLSCLMILAHYNVISDSKSLRLEEFLRRRYRLQRVEEEVNRRIVIGFFDTLYWSREFRRRQDLRKTGRMVTIPDFQVPEIYIDDQDGHTPNTAVFPPDTTGSAFATPITPLQSTPDRPKQAGLGVAGMSPVSPATPEQQRARGNSFGSSPARSDNSFDKSPTLRPRRPSDMSDVDPFTMPYDGSGAAEGPSEPRSRRPRANTLSPSMHTGASGLSTSFEGGSTLSGTRHRRQQSNLSAMEAFDNSAWGESIRRSFTLRRQNTRGRGRMGRGVGDV